MEDDRRQHECIKKYEVIVNQYDEIIEAVDARTRQQSKRRRRLSRSSKVGKTSMQQRQASEKEGLVEILTRFINDL